MNGDGRRWILRGNWRTWLTLKLLFGFVEQIAKIDAAIGAIPIGIAFKNNFEIAFLNGHGGLSGGQVMCVGAGMARSYGGG